jgi:hypothetical protein
MIHPVIKKSREALMEVSTSARLGRANRTRNILERARKELPGGKFDKLICKSAIFQDNILELVAKSVKNPDLAKAALRQALINRC